MRYIVTIAFLAATSVLYAQKKVVDQEINLTKEREISIPKATKLNEKIAPLKSETTEKKMNYSFYDRKPSGIEETIFSPVITQPTDKSKENDDFPLGFDNYLKVGVGNFGRIYGETYINTPQDQPLVLGLSALHNSTRKGPVDGNKSAQSLTKIGLDGKYHQNTFEVKLNAGFENRRYYFYGYDTVNQNLPEYTRTDLKQRFNIYNANATIENTKPKPLVDYKITTGIYAINDNYKASETDWATTLNAFFPVWEDKIKAVVNAEAYLTQMADGNTNGKNIKRNLFRIEPAFTFDFGSFSAKLGYKAVSQSDDQPTISKGYPSVTLAYKTPSLVYIFAGYDGDIVRNTYRSFVNDNPWLKEQMNIQNTFKNQDIFIGARGELYSGISFNTKVSYGKYQNLYYFDQYGGTTFSPNGETLLHVTKFDVVYDDVKTDFVHASGEIGYRGFEIWKPNLKLDYYHYGKGTFEKPWHRPSFVGRLGNNITITDRLVSSIDLYYIGGIFARDTHDIYGTGNPSGATVKLKDIVDLNAEFTYLFTDHLSAFVKMNNILGKNYQRYYNYSQLGLNFLVGINIAL